MWWKILLFVWIAVFSALAVMTPVAGGLGDLAMIAQGNPQREIPVQFTIADRASATQSVDGTAFLVKGTDRNGREATFALPSKPADFETSDGYLVMARYDSDNHRVAVGSILGPRPWMSFPFIPGLEERAKIIFFHVPMSWLTVIAFLVSMWYGIAYLRRKDIEDDKRSSVSAELGLLFCIVATITGSVWAKFNWGSFWNWDPRETSIFVLLLVYGAYFVLRSAIEIDEKRASLSAVYSILAFVTVPFFIFIMPRIMPGLHPGSADDTNSGPVVSKGGIDAMMRIVLYSLLAGFIVVYGWIMKIQMRIHRISLKHAGS